MDSSPYLAQAMAALAQTAQPPPQQQPGIDPAMLAQVLQQRKAFQAANPGQSSLGHNLGQAVQNVQGLPQRLGAIPGQVGANLQQLPGLLGLGARGLP